MEACPRPTGLEPAEIGMAISVVSWPIAGAYLFVVNPLSINFLSGMSPEQMWIAPTGAFLVSTVLGFGSEIWALKQKGFASNTITNTLWAKSKNPLSMGAGFVYGMVMNPVNLELSRRFISGQELDVTMWAHVLSISILGLAYVAINSAIATGNTDGLVSLAKQVNEKTVDKVKYKVKEIKSNMNLRLR